MGFTKMRFCGQQRLFEFRIVEKSRQNRPTFLIWVSYVTSRVVAPRSSTPET
jgi:hypothetical protein